jgi:biopolymer transport protein ExbD
MTGDVITGEAHVIHAPGARLVRRAPLRFVRERAGGARRKVNASVDMVSLLDVLLVMVLFILGGLPFCEGCPRPDPRLPAAWNGDELYDAVFVEVNNERILVDGVRVGSARVIADAERLRDVSGLGNVLASKRALWKQVQPNKPFPGTCLLHVDADVPVLVVKSVFATAVRAGYPNVSFMVRQLPAPPLPYPR